MATRKKTLLTVAIVAIVTVSGVSVLARRQADNRAAAAKRDIEAVARKTSAADLERVSAESASETWSGDPAHLEKALFTDVDAQYEGSAFDQGRLSVTFSTGWAWESRCVYALLSDHEAAVEIGRGPSCAVRGFEARTR
jgi:hypothetical protein